MHAESQWIQGAGRPPPFPNRFSQKTQVSFRQTCDAKGVQGNFPQTNFVTHTHTHTQTHTHTHTHTAWNKDTHTHHTHTHTHRLSTHRSCAIFFKFEERPALGQVSHAIPCRSDFFLCHLFGTVSFPVHQTIRVTPCRAGASSIRHQWSDTDGVLAPRLAAPDPGSAGTPVVDPVTER